MKISFRSLFWLSYLLISKNILANDNLDVEYDTSSDLNEEPNLSLHGRALEVFPPDNRVKYDPYTKQRGIGLLQYSEDGILKNCTATFINREIILTAASCVMTDRINEMGQLTRYISNEWNETAQFHFGYNNGKPGLHNAIPKTLFIPQAYMGIEITSAQNNFAVIQLNKALGDVTGFMSIQPLRAKEYKTRTVNLIGFMFNGTAGADYCCRIIGTFDGRVKHLCDVGYGGNGAPLFIQTRTRNKQNPFSYKLLAVHNGVAISNGQPIFNLAAVSKPIASLLQFANQNIQPNPQYTGVQWPDVIDQAMKCANIVKPTRKPTPKPFAFPPIPTRKPGGVNPTPKPVTQQNPTPKPVTQQNPTPKPVTQQNPTPKPVTQQNPTPKPVTQQNPTPKPVQQPNPTPKPKPPTCDDRRLLTDGGGDGDCKPPTKPPVNPTPKPVQQPNPTPKPKPPTCDDRRLLTDGGGDGDCKPPTKPPVNPTPKPVQQPKPPTCDDRRLLTGDGGEECAKPSKPPVNPTPKPAPKPSNPPKCDDRRQLDGGNEDGCGDENDEDRLLIEQRANVQNRLRKLRAR